MTQICHAGTDDRLHRFKPGHSIALAAETIPAHDDVGVSMRPMYL